MEVSEKSSYQNLAQQNKEAFMKANPEFRWHKMPPVSVENLPVSAQKHPVAVNGDFSSTDTGSKLMLESRSSSSSSRYELDMVDDSG